MKSYVITQATGYVITQMKSYVVMANGFAHKLTEYKLQSNAMDGPPKPDDWEEVLVSRVTEHPELGFCYVGHPILGVGLFNVLFPKNNVRLPSEIEVESLLKRRYRLGKSTCGIDRDEIATQEILDKLLYFPWERLR